jgi:nitrite reductase (NO-forming)
VEFKLDVPGTFLLVDHSIFRTFNKGSLGMLKVAGAENKAIYSGKEVDEAYLGGLMEGGGQKVAALTKEYNQAIKDDPKLQKLSKEILVVEGKKVFGNNCSMCHGVNGEGVAGVFPPLAKSDYLSKLASAESRDALIGIPTNGLTGKVTVNGTEYNGVMPALSALSEDELAAVLTFVTNSWGNSAKPVSVEEVRKAKAALRDQQVSHPQPH